MIPGQRRPDRSTQVPGDLYLDPAVPERERVHVSCGAWSGQATHVWSGHGWSRLHGPVRPVPTGLATPPPPG